MNLKPAALFILLLASLGAACSKDTTTAPSTTSPQTVTFSSALVPGGTSSHTFTISQGGTINVTLTNAGAPTTFVGLGLGIPNPTGTGCNLSIAVATAAGANPQISASVDAGTYCVRIYDFGRLTDTVGFAITIAHP